MSTVRDYVPPPPPPRGGGSSCFKWGGIACGGGCLLIVLLVVIVLVAMPAKWKSFWGQVASMTQDARAVAQDERLLWKDIERYHTDTGKYPNKLQDLVPKYVPNTSALRLSTKPEGPEFTYHKPAANSPDTFVVLEYELSLTAPDARSSSIIDMETLKNGSFVQKQETAVPNPGGASGGR